jgi:hypothetical protein
VIELYSGASMSISQIRSEFDEFLYAPIEEGGNGMLLSVLSALARLDIDPWQEAGNLTRMSRECAAQRLASLISMLPGGALTHLNAGTVATRLITLLPPRHSINIAPGKMLPGAGTLNHSRVFMYILIINATLLALTVGSQYFTANRQPPLRASFTQALAAKTAAPKVPLPSFGK